MRLEHYIAELLYRYNCVVVPEFGAFLANTNSARIVGNTIHPPSKSLSFNQQLYKNDGLLVSYIASSKQLSHDALLEEVVSVAKNWKEKLVAGGELRLEKIGKLWMGQEERILFAPEGQENYLAAAFGLSSVNGQKVTREVLKEEVEAMEEAIPFSITPEKRHNPIRPLYKYAAVALLLLATGTTSLLVLKQNQSNKLLVAEQAREAVDRHIQDATFFQTAPLELPPLDVKVTKKETAMAYNHHIIAGAFREKANADRKIGQLQAMGYKARYLGVNKFGLHQVAYQSFVESKDALRYLRQIKRTVSKDAWMLSEK